MLQEALPTPSSKRPLHPYLPLDLIFTANRREIFSRYRGKVSNVKPYEPGYRTWTGLSITPPPDMQAMLDNVAIYLNLTSEHLSAKTVSEGWLAVGLARVLLLTNIACMSAQCPPEHHVTRNPKGRRQAWALMVLSVIILLNTNDKLIHDAMECFLWTVGGIFAYFHKLFYVYDFVSDIDDLSHHPCFTCSLLPVNLTFPFLLFFLCLF